MDNETPAEQVPPSKDEKPEPKRFHDAVLFGKQHQEGDTHPTRVNGACDLTEPFLGGQAHIRDIGGSFLATRSPHDKLNFPVDHDRAMECRYTWEDGPNGLKLGTLKPEAR